MRHIPEEELHAYLDQALSRTQCVEIERHLARCSSCKRHRDNIAALRDRTTSLLARIGPPTTLAPSFAELRLRAAARAPEPVKTRRWLAPTAWAAGIAATVLITWQVTGRSATPAPAIMTASASLPASEPPIAPAATQQEIPLNQQVHVAVSSPKPHRPAPARSLVRATRPVGNDAPDASDFAPAYEADSAEFLHSVAPRQLALAAPSLTVDDMVAQPVSADPGFDGLWRTIAPGDDSGDGPADVPLVPGLPVIQMRQQPPVNGQGKVTAVDQLLESGEIIRTVSGPVSRVQPLVDEDSQTDTTRSTVSYRQGGRMISVTGPAQALGSLLSRVDMKAAKRRY